MSRRLRLLKARTYGCSDCSWQMRTPDVGIFGHRTGRARVATLRGAFASHKCELHPTARDVAVARASRGHGW